MDIIIDDSTPFGERAGGADGLQRLLWSIADAPVFSAALRRRLRKVAARVAAGPFDTVLGDLRFRLYPAENYCDRVIWARRRLPEPAEHAALDPYIGPGTHFIDIGANIGTYSVYVANRSGGSARILALEPHPRTYQKLRFNMVANKAANIDAVAAAVGPERTTVSLWSDGGSNIGHSSIEKAGTSNPKLSVSVPCIPLHDLVLAHGFERIDLLKIDIEGFEDRALMPFFRSAPARLWPRAMLIEIVHRDIWHEDILNYFSEIDYSPAFSTAENVLLVRSSRPQ